MTLRLQKFSPIDREHAVIEIVDDLGEVLIDVSRNDQDTLEVRFHPALGGRVLLHEEVMALIEQAGTRAMEDD